MAGSAVAAIYHFDRFVLDLGRGVLIADGVERNLRPKSFSLLCHFVENAGRLIDRDEINRAVWPGAFVTDDSIAQCVSDLRRALNDPQQRLLRTLPRRGYVLAVETQRVDDAPSDIAPPRPEASISEKPAIAVLPFQNMSGDPEQDHFADGMAEDIITALSRIRWLSVLARNSTFTYKGRAVDVKQVGRELGVRYVLEGSVQKAAGRVRITAQLIEAETSAHLWADRFDGSLEDVFDLQDSVAASIADVIEPALQAAETARAATRNIRDGSTAGANPGSPILVALPFTAISPQEQVTADALNGTLVAYLAHASIRVVPVATSPDERSAELARLRLNFAARYAVAGTAQQAADGLRVTVNLTDTATGVVLWADSFTQLIEAGHRSEVEAAKRLARAINYQLDVALARQAKGDPDDWSTAELFAKARIIETEREWTPYTLDEAKAWYERAIRKNPNSAAALRGVAQVLVAQYSEWQTSETTEGLARAERLLTHARESAPRSSGVAQQWGVYHLSLHQDELALEDFRRAVELNPSNVSGYAQIGLTLVKLGHLNEGLAQIRYALQLSPKDEMIKMMRHFEALAELELGDPAAALSSERLAFVAGLRTPRMHAAMAAIYAWLGDKPRAIEKVGELRKIGDQLGTPPLVGLGARNSQTTDRLPLPKYTEGLCRALAWAAEAETSKR
jgi:TolB-like protein